MSALLFPAGAFVLLALGSGCGKRCDDDGFAWQQDPQCLAMLTQTEAMTEPGESTGETDSMTTPTTTMGEGQQYCVDADGDGHGDPTMCTNVPDGGMEPDGTVPNGDDCDDADGSTFPGAAPKDDPDACMKDADGDDYGDMDPPPGNPDDPVVPGTDCDDSNGNTYPGTAEIDSPTACMKDDDDDGHGDDDPPPGPDGTIEPGSDCDDDDAGVAEDCNECTDADMDGSGVCANGEPPPGQDMADCDDNDPFTFPGSSPNDDPDACMTDKDDDDYGDEFPTDPDALPGTDCDDSDADTFVGSAPMDDPAACMKDGDDDDHGDAHPDNPNVDPGNDCNDDHPGINPTESVLITAPINTGDISEVDPETGTVTPVVTLDVSNVTPWIPTSLAVNPTNRSIYAALAFYDSIATMDYCGGGMPTPLPSPHNRALCGIAFDSGGQLYGIDGVSDDLITFNEDGSVQSIVPLTLDGANLNVLDCGLTFDCHSERMLFSDTGTNAIYQVNTADGTVTKLAEVDGEMFGNGVAYEPVTKRALSCSGTKFYSIALDGTNAFTPLPDLSAPADDLEFAPACN